MQTSLPAGASHPAQFDSDPDYVQFEKLIAERVASLRGPLFTTDVEGLFDAYLAGIPGETQKAGDVRDEGLAADLIHSGPRQHYNCRHCRKFVERYGGLVRISETGRAEPALWAADDRTQPDFFIESLSNLYEKVCMAKITGVFINDAGVWGTPSNTVALDAKDRNGNPSQYRGTRWTHLHGTPHGSLRLVKDVLTADQRMAELKQDHGTLKHALSDYSLEACFQAIRVLEADELSRGEKMLGVVKWLHELHLKQDGLPAGRARDRCADNILWLAVVQAPPGWCHVRSNVIHTLLDDIVAGKDFNTIKRSWDAKMHPLKYMRPVAAPTDGQITAANKVMEKLQAAGALDRRYCRLDEVTSLWEPATPTIGENIAAGDKAAGGAFDSLRRKQPGIKPVELPPKAVKWGDFLSTFEKHPPRSIEVLLTIGAQSFYGLVTSVNPDSPPMLQWDGLYQPEPGEIYNHVRNPVSTYCWHGGSSPSQWGLQSGWTEVAAICRYPHLWQQPEKFLDSHGDGVMFVLHQARDTVRAGGYFPETLRSEYHAIRSVIEEHARQSRYEQLPEGVPGANGIYLNKNITLTVRVDGADVYRLSM